MKTKDLHLLFSERDIELIEAAIRQAEAASPVEIVPFVIDASDTYEHAYWKTLALVLALAVCFKSAWLAVGLPVAVLSAYFLWPPLRRFIIGARKLDERVWKKAKEVFLDEEVFNTKQRTGVLILISLFEREVAILSDSGIYVLAPSEQWKVWSDRLAEAMKTFDPTPTLLQAIEQIGLVAQQKGFNRGDANPNELENRLRIESSEE